MNNRRDFLISSAGLAAAWAAGPLGARAQEPAAVNLPKVQFGKYDDQPLGRRL